MQFNRNNVATNITALMLALIVNVSSLSDGVQCSLLWTVTQKTATFFTSKTLLSYPNDLIYF